MQKQLLQQLTTGGAAAAGAPLRSLRQLGWPLGQHQVLGLLHDQLSDAAGSAVAVTPFVLGSFFQSAAALAGVVRDYLAIEGKGMPAVEQALLTVCGSRGWGVPCKRRRCAALPLLHNAQMQALV